MSLIPSRSMSSRRQTVLEFIRRHFRSVGSSPSHAEIAGATGLRRAHVGRWLEELRAAGLITYTPYQARSIVLVDRMANFSDSELRLAAAGRGWTIIDTPVPALTKIFTVDPVVPEFGLHLLDQLEHIEGTRAGCGAHGRHDGAGRAETESGQAAAQRATGPDAEDRPGDA